jgi:hypothetical protein
VRNICFATAVVLGCAALAGSASAQGLSYESRGYGGPLYVGPNFQQGGQHAPPVYGQGRTKTERASDRPERSAKTRKGAPSREAKSEKSTPAAKTAAKTDNAADAENSTIAAAHVGHTDTAASTLDGAPPAPVTCKRYVAAVGQTVTVPCD